MSPSRFVNVHAPLLALALGGAMIFSAACGSSGGNNSGTGGTRRGRAPPACTASDTQVCFKDGQAQGAMTGYGWIALGMLDTLTDPTCDTDKHAIDAAHACTTTTNWNSSNALCMSGTIPALPATPFQSDYDNNWGIQIGVNTSEPPGTTLGKAHTSITITHSGRAFDRAARGGAREGRTRGGRRTAPISTSGQAIPMSKFNLECWNGDSAAPSKALSSDNIPNIDKVGMQVSSTATEIKVENLCLQSIRVPVNG